MDISFLRRLVEYDYWANREALASLEPVGGADGRSLQLFNHIIGAQRIWLARFETPAPSSIEVWPDLPPGQCQAAIDELHRLLVNLLDKLTPEKLHQHLSYRNTKGLEFRTPIQDVLMHLVMHSAYHRGQVAGAVRAAGGKPAATDYVVYVRQMEKR